MKPSFLINLKKTAVFLLATSLPLVFGGCEKDPFSTKPENPDSPQKHNVELVYGHSFSRDWQNIAIDTIYKYTTDPTVDTIFMIPENYDQFATLNTTQMRNYVVPKLRERHNVNPNKVFGKGTIKLSNMAANDPQIHSFFSDTLHYTVIGLNQKTI